LLEIAIFRSGSDTLGGATELLGMRLNDQVNIEFL
jgi:predicted HTH domain antitoxin